MTNNAYKPLENADGITIAQFKKWIKDLPEIDSNGDDYEVWVETGFSISSPAQLIIKLNEGDILIKPE